MENKNKQTNCPFSPKEIVPGVSFDDARKGVAVIGSPGSGKSVFGMEVCLRTAARGGSFVAIMMPQNIFWMMNIMKKIGREDDLLICDNASYEESLRAFDNFPHEGKCIFIPIHSIFSSATPRDESIILIERLTEALYRKPLLPEGGATMVIDEYDYATPTTHALRIAATRIGMFVFGIGQMLTAFMEEKETPLLEGRNPVIHFKSNSSHDPSGLLSRTAIKHQIQMDKLFRLLTPGEYYAINKEQLFGKFNISKRTMALADQKTWRTNIKVFDEMPDEMPFAKTERHGWIDKGISTAQMDAVPINISKSLIKYCDRILLAESHTKRIEATRKIPFFKGRNATANELHGFLSQLLDLSSHRAAPAACFFNHVKDENAMFWYAIREMITGCVYPEAQPILRRFYEKLSGEPTWDAKHLP